MNLRDVYIALPPELEQYRHAAQDLLVRFSNYTSPSFDIDDLASVISVSFYRALLSYSPDEHNGCPLLNWLYYLTAPRIIDAYRRQAGPISTHTDSHYKTRELTQKARRAMFRTSLDAPLTDDGDCLKDILFSNDISVCEQVAMRLDREDEFLHELIMKYTFESERPLLFAYFGITPYTRKSQTQLALELKCKRQWVNFKIARIFRRLRKSPGLLSELQARGFFHFVRGGKPGVRDSPRG